MIDANLRRPAGVEGWLPIAGLMNLKYCLLSGQIPAVHPCSAVPAAHVSGDVFLLRETFCSWLCPVGSLSEYLWRAGEKILKRNFHLPRWVDLPLRGSKYFLLGLFLWAISTMSVVGIRDFMFSPYGLIADVKMLNFFRHIERLDSSFSGYCGGLCLGVEFLVLVPLPPWSAIGTYLLAESHKDSQKHRDVH